MKNKSQIFLYVVLISLFLSTCTSQEAFEISCDNFYETQHRSYDIEISVGDEFDFSLCSNPSTGFQWMEQAEISDPELIEQVGHEMVPSAETHPPPPPGSPGEQVWSFKALGPGQCAISLEYSQPWDGGEKAVWTFVLNVSVE